MEYLLSSSATHTPVKNCGARTNVGPETNKYMTIKNQPDETVKCYHTRGQDLAPSTPVAGTICCKVTCGMLEGNRNEQIDFH
mmetsp:Transcript_34296/g.55169  ORF Transcript_34296/g.55169 Transcript_34296/m.55169 type:complete len:82 (-) Transcript_34296:157-402(-)